MTSARRLGVAALALTARYVYCYRDCTEAFFLFQNRFKSVLVKQDTYFLELVRYIHLCGAPPENGSISTSASTVHRQLRSSCTPA
jgi:hypothetical protein